MVNPQVGIVKQVLSGDTVIVRKNVPDLTSPERMLVLGGIIAPKLARQKNPNNESDQKDEPLAWESREFMRNLLLGKMVKFISETKIQDKEYATIWPANDPNKDVNTTMLSEGLVKLRDGARNNPNNKELAAVEAKAKAKGKGVWAPNAQVHVRNVKWQVDDLKSFITQHNYKPIDAIVEYVRDGATFRLLLLPTFHYVTVTLAGVRCPRPHEPLAEEAKLFVERYVLQRDVKVTLELVNNNNFIGSIYLPEGNIGELVLGKGYGKLIEWSVRTGLMELKKAEQNARNARIGVWANYDGSESDIQENEKDISGTVTEVIGGDTLVIKTNAGTIKRASLSSIRPPRERAGAVAAIAAGGSEEDAKAKYARRLYEVPYLFEAREYLRKKLVGKKAIITVDFKQPATERFPEKINCTVQIGGLFIAEALVAKGLASVVRHRNDDDQRSVRYEKLVEAEQKAIKAGVGIHSKEPATVRIQDICGQAANSRKFFPYLKRLGKTEAVVEYVISASRMKLYIPKERVLVNMILAGIMTPRNAPQNAAEAAEKNPIGELGLNFTKEVCLQHDVEVSVVDIDKAGVYIGWIFVNDVNLSVNLVRNGLANLHGSSQSSEYGKELKEASDEAYRKRVGVWHNYIEKKPVPKEPSSVPERRLNYETVLVTVVNPDGTFYVQNVENRPKLIALGQNLCQEFINNPPVPGTCWPNKGKICAARFSRDGNWYRARIDKVVGNIVTVYYIDYGNREETNYNLLAELPAVLRDEPPYTSEHFLACFKFPPDPDDHSDAVKTFAKDTRTKNFLMNVEIRGSPSAVTLIDPMTHQDIGKALIADGLALVHDPRDRRLTQLVAEYRAAQDIARAARLNIWRHGDVTEDDAVEFGARR